METRTSQPEQCPPEGQTPPARLPFRITLLVILVLITTALSAVRLYTALAWAATLQSYTSPALDAYVAITGAFWTLVGGFVLWSFWRGTRYTRVLILAAAAAYSLWLWADRLLVQQEGRSDWRFDLLITVLLLVYTAFVVLDRHNRIYFSRESYDR